MRRKELLPKIIRIITSILLLLSSASKKSLFSYVMYTDDANEMNSNNNCIIGVVLSIEKIVFNE